MLMTVMIMIRIMAWNIYWLRMKRGYVVRGNTMKKLNNIVLW